MRAAKIILSLLILAAGIASKDRIPTQSSRHLQVGSPLTLDIHSTDSLEVEVGPLTPGTAYDLYIIYFDFEATHFRLSSDTLTLPSNTLDMRSLVTVGSQQTNTLTIRVVREAPTLLGMHKFQRPVRLTLQIEPHAPRKRLWALVKGWVVAMGAAGIILYLLGPREILQRTVQC